MDKRKDYIVSARRTVEPWYLPEMYDLVSGKRHNPNFTKSVWANACMQIRGMELANLPWRLVKNDKPIDRHPLIDMLKDFGRESFWEDAMYSTEFDKLQWGAAFWLRDADVLRRLNPSTMKVIKNNEGISGFEQKITKPNGQTVTYNYSRDEIVYFRGYDPDDDLGPGIPIMQVVKSAINTEYEAEQLIQAHFRNDAIPGLLLTSEQHIPEDEANRIVQWWNKRFRGSRKAGNVGLADRGLQAQVLSHTMVENELIKVRELARTDICAGFRVSKLLVSAFIESTYANAAESRKSLIENLIGPEAKMYANAINQDLVPQVDPSVKFEFAPEELPIMQEDESQKANRLLMQYNAGLISAEYFRMEMGIEEKFAPDDVEKKEEERVEKQYEKKAQKALARGESPAVSFESDVLSVDRRILIDARLKNAKTAEDVKRAFR